MGIIVEIVDSAIDWLPPRPLPRPRPRPTPPLTASTTTTTNSILELLGNTTLY